tara:strand:- start:893 stop:1333 length:441 start_codon:yes stop_codon:yes gene_type:complete
MAKLSIKKSAASVSSTKVASVASATSPVVQSPAQLRFTSSMSKIKTTGDKKADQIATAVVTRIFSKELKMVGTPEDGFKGKIGKTVVKLSTVKMGKSNRYILSVGPVEIGGQYASKAFSYATTQNKPQAPGKTYDQDALDSVLELL